MRATICGTPANKSGNSTAIIPFGKIRDSAHDVTAAYPLRSKRNGPANNIYTSSQQGWKQKSSSNWSVNNIGFSGVEGETRSRKRRENCEGYMRAAFAVQVADKPYIAEVAHFRFRYPHTLGRIAALSHARSDRAGALA